MDHPRVGGGTQLKDEQVIGDRGPSPRGRGNPNRRLADGNRHGTIPAWAGEPFRYPASEGTTRDHPRVGGGTTAIRGRGAFVWGPSPRGRGNRNDNRHQNLAQGTIPAWAGEPFDVLHRQPRQWDHPRVGGGTQPDLTAASYMAGPSPRGRGNPHRSDDQPLCRGTIPAWAGEPATLPFSGFL